MQFATFLVVNTDDSGSGTLRQAIIDANNSVGKDTIHFELPAGLVHVITPNTPLPIIADPITINGYSQSGSAANTSSTGSNAKLLIELNGRNVTNGIGIQFSPTATGSELIGVSLTQWSQQSISVQASGTQILGSFVGVGPSGSQSLSDSAGIDVIANDVIIGGDLAADRNVISVGTASNKPGIIVSGNRAIVAGNLIGTDASGARGLGNSIGVQVLGSSSRIRNNTISGNTLVGISIEGINAQSNRIESNTIGLSSARDRAVANNGMGVRIISGASNNTIGGVELGNHIAGNTDGIVIDGSLTNNNQIVGNFLGSASSTSSTPLDAVAFFNADGDSRNSLSNSHLQPVPPPYAPDFGPGAVGQGFWFNGVDDYITVGAPANLMMTTEFSFQAWVIPMGSPFWSGIIFSKDGEYQLTRFYDGTLRYWVQGLPDWVNSGIVVPNFAWMHVAVTFRQGMFELYTNGVLVHSNPDLPTSFGDLFLTYNEFQIGNRDQDNPAFMGVIDEAAIFNRRLTSSEIATSFSEAIAGRDGVSALNPVSFWRGEGNFHDSVGTNHGFDQGIIYAPGVDGQSFQFDGEIDFLNAGNQDEFRFSETMSFQGWVRPTGPGSGVATSYEGGIIVNKEGEYEVRRNNDGTLSFAFANSTPGWAWVNTPIQLPLEQWSHIAVTYDRGIVRIYKNGSLEFTSNGSGPIGDLNPNENDLRFGGRQVADQFFAGQLDQLAVYDRILTPTEIVDSYTRGQAGLDGITATRPVAAWLANNNLDDSNGQFRLSKSWQRYANGVSGRSFEFDGRGEQLSVSNAAELKMTEQLSVEAWIYPTGPGAPSSLQIPTIVSREGEYQLVRTGTGEIWYSIANTSPGWDFVQTGYFAPLNAWTHLVLTYDGSQSRLYANGVLVHSINSAGPVGDAVPELNDFRIGGRHFAASHFEGKFEGRIDNVAIYNRVLPGGDIANHYRLRGTSFSSSIGNQGDGIRISGGANNNVIGGASTGEGNIIAGSTSTSANVQAGVRISGSGTTNNRVLGNSIGVPNQQLNVSANEAGIIVELGASLNLIGNTLSNGRNVISRNDTDGILITDANTSFNTISGNWIGLDSTGLETSPNGGHGVRISNGASNNAIGSSIAGGGNVISGNVGDGIRIDGATTTGNIARGNSIGLNSSGDRTVHDDLVLWLDGQLTVDNLVTGNRTARIRGDVRSDGSLVFFNAQGEVTVPNDQKLSSLNKLTLEATLLSLSGDGVPVQKGRHADGLGTYGIVGGGQHWYFYVRVNGALIYSDPTFISSSITSRNVLTGTFDGQTLRFYKNGVQVGQGKTVIGSLSYDLAETQDLYVGSNGAGVHYSGALDNIRLHAKALSGSEIAGMAGDYRRLALANQGSGIRVDGATNTTISGTSTSGPNIIGGHSNGISIQNAMGTTVAGNRFGLVASSMAPIGNAIDVLVDNSTNTTIGGTQASDRNVLANFDGTSISIVRSRDALVANNYIGTDSTGTRDRGRYGVGIDVGSSSGIKIGQAGAGNTLSGSNRHHIGASSDTQASVLIQSNLIGLNAFGDAIVSDSPHVQPVAIYPGNNIVIGTDGDGISDSQEGNTIVGVTHIYGGSNIVMAGNLIGMNSSGTAAIGRGSEIQMYYGSNNRIGTNADGVSDRWERNTINAGNSFSGIYGSGATGLTIQGNFIGTDSSGTKSLGNATGILLFGSQANIGGTTSASGNLISGNLGNGISVYSGQTDVRNNIIGLAADGRSILPNSFGIGWTQAGGIIESNTISGNSNSGIVVANKPSPQALVIQNNRIGSDTTGASPAPNLVGISIYEDLANTTIGSTSLAGENNISFNRTHGIQMPGSSSVPFLLGNRFFSNGGMAIEVGSPGTQLNDMGDLGPNLNFPIITKADIDGVTNDLVVEGFVGQGRTIDFYRANSSQNVFAGGEQFLFSATEGSSTDTLAGTEVYGPFVNGIEVGTDLGSRFRFRIPMPPGLAIGDQITAIAKGSTSEFGPSVLVGTYQGNLAPVVTLTPTVSSQSNTTPFQLTGSFVDEDSIRWTAFADPGDGTAVIPLQINADQTFTFSHQFANPGTYTVTVRVSDNGNQVGVANSVVKVLNEAPELPAEKLTITSPVVEGDLVRVTGSYSDVDLLSGHVILVDFGNSSPPVLAQLNTTNRTFSAEYRYLDDGISDTPVDLYQVSVTVTDPLGSSFSNPLGSIVAEVRNFSPQFLSLAPVRYTVFANEDAVISGSFFDAGVLDQHTITFDWDDGTAPTVITPTVGTRSFSGVSHRFGNITNVAGETFHVRVTISDDDDPAGQTQTLAITVVPTPPATPTLQLSSDTIREGESVLLTGTFADIGVNDVHDIVINWGDGVESLFRSTPGSYVIPETRHTYQDDPKTVGDFYTIVVTIRYQNGQTATANRTIVIQNQAPTLSNLVLSTVGPFNEGDALTVTGSYADVGTLDSHIINVLWGDGVTTQAEINTELFTFTATHTLRDDSPTGTPSDANPVMVSIVDSDGGSIAQSAGTITVNNVAPLVTIGANPLQATTSSTIHLRSNVVDPGVGDTHSYRWIVYEDNSTTPVYDVTGSSSTLAYVRNPSVFYHRISVVVTDDDTGTSSDSLIVQTLDDSNNLLIQPPQPTLPSGVTRFVIFSLGGADTVDVSNWTIPVLLDGGAGKDILYGGSADDQLILHQGDDEGYGGPGNDAYRMTFNSTLTVSDFSGSNSLDFSTTQFGVTFDFAATTSLIPVTQDVGQATNEPNQHFARINGNFSSLVATPFADRVIGRNNSTTDGGAGADRFEVKTGASGVTFLGGADADLFANNLAVGTIIFDGGADADLFSNALGASIASINFSGDDGIDSVANFGTIDAMFFGGGADADLFSNSGIIESIIFSGGADGDTFTNINTLDTLIFDGGADADLFSNQGLATNIIFDGGADADTFSNLGTILEIYFGGGADADTLSNFGTIDVIQFDGGADADLFSNVGTATSIIFDGGADADLFSNAGTLVSVIFDGGADADTFENAAGGILDSIQFQGDSGDDRFLQKGSATSITFVGGMDADLFSNLGTTQTIIFDGGADADTISNFGTITVIHFDAGADADLFANAGIIEGNILFNGDAGFDRFINSGTIELELQISSFTNAAAFSNNALFQFNGGADTDTFINRGQIQIRVSLPNNGQSDQMTRLGSIVVNGGADADLFVNLAEIQIIFSGDDQSDIASESGQVLFVGAAGDDTFINQGSISRALSGSATAGLFAGIPVLRIIGGNDADLFVNNSSILDQIDFSGDAGDDQVINRGELRAFQFTAGPGSDTLLNAGSIEGALSLVGDSSIADAGNDTLINEGVVGSINFIGLSGNDLLVNRNSSPDSIRFEGGDGDDAFANEIDNIPSLMMLGGNGDDKFFNSGRNIAQMEMIGDSGNDTFLNYGDSFGSQTFYGHRMDGTTSNDRDILLNRGNGSENSSIAFFGNSGNDLMQQFGNSIQTVVYHGGDGDDLLVNRGHELQSIQFNGGNQSDRFENFGNLIGSLQLLGGNGSNALFNAGSVISTLEFQGGSDDDLLVNIGDRVADLLFNASEGNDHMMDQGSFGNRTRYFGGEGDDRYSLANSFANDLLFDGGNGNDSWNITSRSFVLERLEFQAGAGDDSWTSSGADLSQTVLVGGSGDDRFIDKGRHTTNWNAQGNDGNDVFAIMGMNGVGFQIAAGNGDDSILITATDTSQLTVDGGSGDDRLSSEGTKSSMAFFGQDGADFFSNTGDDHTLLRFVGGPGNDRFQNHGSNVDQVLYDTGTGNNSFLQSGSNIDLISVFAESGNNNFINYGSFIADFMVTSGNGDDSILSTGSDIASFLIGFGNGTNSAQIRGSQFQDIQLNGGTGVDSLVLDAGESPSLVLHATGSDSNDTFVVRGSIARGTIDGGNGDDRFIIGSLGDLEVLGLSGNDRYQFLNAPSGSVVIGENENGTNDGSRDLLDFSSYFAGPINLDLAVIEPQPQPQNNALKIILSSPLGVEDVIGTSGSDTILGNARPNNLAGALLVAGNSAPPVQLVRTQYVLLDFTTYTVASDGEHIYSVEEQVAIRDRIARDYRGADDANPIFDVRVVLDVQEIPESIRNSSSYVTIFFNRTPDFQRSGGLASEIDFGNKNLSGYASVQINGLLGGTQLPPRRDEDLLNSAQEDAARQAIGLKPIATSTNFVLLSGKLGTHELGHLIGLRHTDVFGPIGFGMSSPPGAGGFKPLYVGPVAAFESFDHLIGSPATIGTNRFHDLRDLEFGEREAVKLAIGFADPNALRISEQAEPHTTIATAQTIGLLPLAVPTTVRNGLSRGYDYSVKTRYVTGAIGLTDSKSESDYYRISGTAGEIVTVELMSTIIAAARSWGNQTIDSVVRLYDSLGSLVPYHGSLAENDDQFEPTDSLLLDVVLPSDGNYYIEVDTFWRSPSDPNYQAAVARRTELESKSQLTPAEIAELNRLRESLDDQDTGSYELLVYSFAQSSRIDGVDNLKGRGGVDLIEGGREDRYDIQINPGTLPRIDHAKPFTHTIEFTDRGGLTQRTFVDYGDGTGEQEAPIDIATQSFSIGTSYSTAGTKTIRLRMTNDDLRETIQSISIVVEAVNAAPTNLSLSNASIPENSLNNTIVGSLLVEDTTPNEQFAFSFVAGAGDSDNLLFAISNGQLVFTGTSDFEIRSTYTVRVKAVDSGNNSIERALNVTVTDLLEVQNVKVGDGQTQRSMVNLLTLTFDNLINLSSGAIRIFRRGDNQNVPLVISTRDVNNQTLVEIRFTGSLTYRGSGALTNGNYQLEIDGDRIARRGDGQGLDGNRDGTAGGLFRFGHQAADRFYSLYGDIDGDRDVDAIDFQFFRVGLNKRSGMTGYIPAFDIDADNDIDAIDFQFFRLNLNRRLDF